VYLRCEQKKPNRRNRTRISLSLSLFSLPLKRTKSEEARYVYAGILRYLDFFLISLRFSPPHATKKREREKSDVCTERGTEEGTKKNAVTTQQKQADREGRKKKRCVQQLVLYLNARYNGEGKCTEEEEEEEASREREREREGGRWRLEERRPALTTERRRRRRRRR
jgi:hypothetical protein